MIFYRRLFAFLLCGSLLLGPIPAWLHVSSCDGGAADRISPASIASIDDDRGNPGDECREHCCHHSGLPVAIQGLSVVDTQSGVDTSGHDHSDHSSPSHEHDSHSCVICQSLVTPGEVLWQLDIVCDGIVRRFDCPRVTSPFAVAASLAIPQPRGPPVIG